MLYTDILSRNLLLVPAYTIQIYLISQEILNPLETDDKCTKDHQLFVFDLLYIISNEETFLQKILKTQISYLIL